MLAFNLDNPTVYIVLYLALYNISMVVVFSIIWGASALKLRTLNSLKSLSSNPFKKYLLLLVFFSIAGVPPFSGFFAKLNVIAIISLASSLFLLLLAPFLFASLYFYIQNVRYLLLPASSGPKNYIFNDLKANYLQILVLTGLTFFALFGGVVLDDLTTGSNWTLV